MDLGAIAGPTPDASVVLCGSGVSAVAPSNVPSWWGLNDAVLDEIRQIALRALTSPDVRALAATARLEDVPLPAFSQLIADAFAGRSWLDVLTVLNGAEPNGVHRAVMRLVADGHGHTVITTNFDTLLERAGQELGLAVPVVLRGQQGPATGAALHKIHGSVDQPDSMVDLWLDKGRGLGPVTRTQLAAACRGRHLVVLGFSGEDLVTDEDYLGLLAGDGLPSRVTWVCRPATSPGEGARSFLDRLAAAGVPVVTPEYDLAGGAGVAGSGGTDLPRRVRNWLGEALMLPPNAALILAQMLRLRGATGEAATMRAEIRRVLSRIGRDTLHPGVAAAWALLGKEELAGKLAKADLLRAEQAWVHFERSIARHRLTFHGQAVVEQRLLRAAIRQNTAIVALRDADVDGADQFLREAIEILNEVPDPEHSRRMAGVRYQQALLRLVHGEAHVAMIALERSLEYARRCGDLAMEGNATLVLAMCLRATSDDELAAELDRRATRLGRATNDKGWAKQLHDLVAADSSILASGRFADIVTAISPDPLLDDLAAARAAEDPILLAAELRKVVKRDTDRCNRDRLGQLLHSLDLAGDRSPNSLYQRTVRALDADRPPLPDPARFLVEVTALGLSGARISRITLDRLLRLGRPFGFRPYTFVPHGFEDGLTALERTARQGGFTWSSTG